MVLISFFFYLSNLLQLILRKNICETSKMINWNFDDQLDEKLTDTLLSYKFVFLHTRIFDFRDIV